MRMGRVHSLWKHHSGLTIMRWSVVSKIRDLSARNRDRCLMRCAAPRNNTLCIRAKVRAIPTADDLESLQRVHLCIQGTGSHSAIQGGSKTGRVPGNPVLAVVLALGKRSRRRPPLLLLSALPAAAFAWSSSRPRSARPCISCEMARCRLRAALRSRASCSCCMRSCSLSHAHARCCQQCGELHRATFAAEHVGVNAAPAPANLRFCWRR
jgi:hypothetical protein